MMGLNNTVSVQRYNNTTEKWSTVLNSLRCRITDISMMRNFDSELASTTVYTHMLFFEWKKTLPVEVEDHIIDNGTRYAVISIVDAAGDNHHYESRLRRLDK